MLFYIHKEFKIHLLNKVTLDYIANTTNLNGYCTRWKISVNKTGSEVSHSRLQVSNRGCDCLDPDITDQILSKISGSG